MTFLFAAILVPFLRLSGFRNRVVKRNLELMKWRGGFLLRWKLDFNALRDLTALFLGAAPKTLPDSRTKIRLQEMRDGPCMLLTAHFHNWEQLGSLLRHEGVSLLAAARPLKNAWAERLLSRMRARIEVSTVSQSVPRAALKHLDAGGCFALLWDQHAPGPECSDFFFGLPVQMNPLPIFILNHRPCPVYFGVLLPKGGLRLIPLLTRFEANAERKLMRRYHRVLETLVRAHPELWYGFYHARFKNIASYPGHRHAPFSSRRIPDSARHGRRDGVLSPSVRS